MTKNNANKQIINYKYSFMASLFITAISLSSNASSSESIQNVKVTNPSSTSTKITQTSVIISNRTEEHNTPILLHLTRNEGQWLVNNSLKPVIKTINNRMNYMTFYNDSDRVIANLLIPKLDYEVIAKNGVMLSTKCKVNSVDENTEPLWIEPNSNLTIAFINDLSSTPLQAIISKSTKGNKLLAIFGPDKPKEFTLQTEVAVKMDINTKIFTSKDDLELTQRMKQFMSSTKELYPKFTYKISKSLELREFKFSNPVFILQRNAMCAGNHYWAKSFVVFPNEDIQFTTNTITRVD